MSGEFEKYRLGERHENHKNFGFIYFDNACTIRIWMQYDESEGRERARTNT